MTYNQEFRGSKGEPEAGTPAVEWIEPSENPWGIRVLDLRPITQGFTSTSSDPQMARNAISYGKDDGYAFIYEEPESKNEITANITFSVDRKLFPGVLFIPRVMEHKWAIFFHQERILFVRSWLRKVVVTAETYQDNGKLFIHKIRGQFFQNSEPEYIRAIVRFLLISHVIGETFPAPIPEAYGSDLQSAGLWAFSMYGNMAYFGTFRRDFEGSTQTPLRSHTLLHIATARGDLDKFNHLIETGIPVDIFGPDGLAPLHWSVAAEDTGAMERLIKLGADPNVRSAEGATPLMNAAQSNKISHLTLLISSGADVNARDKRGFTSLHRAAEIGYTEIAKILLEKGADPSLAAQGGHTPISLAETRGNTAMVSLLTNYRKAA